jgi:hypothetical protein
VHASGATGPPQATSVSQPTPTCVVSEPRVTP